MESITTVSFKASSDKDRGADGPSAFPPLSCGAGHVPVTTGLLAGYLFVNETQNETCTEGRGMGHTNTILSGTCVLEDAFSLFPKARAIGGGYREELGRVLREPGVTGALASLVRHALQVFILNGR